MSAWAFLLFNVWILYGVIHSAYHYFRPVPRPADALLTPSEKYYRQYELYQLACKVKRKCDHARSLGFPHRCVFCEPK